MSTSYKKYYCCCLLLCRLSMKGLPVDKASFVKAVILTEPIAGKPLSHLPYDHRIKITMNQESQIKEVRITITQNEEGFKTNVKVVKKRTTVTVKTEVNYQIETKAKKIKKKKRKKLNKTIYGKENH